MATRGRYPLALEVFQTLQRYPAIQPRCMPKAPIGCRLYLAKKQKPTRASTDLQQSIPEDAEPGEVQYGELSEDEPTAAATDPSRRTWRGFAKAAAYQSLRHLYHDLGVLVFAGCNADQTRRIGDILKVVASKGGIGGVITGMTPERNTRKCREKLAPHSALNKSLNSHWESTIHLDVLLGMASARLRKSLAEDLVVAGVGRSDFEIREVSVTIPHIRQRKGVTLLTDSGVRTLSVDSYSSTRLDRTSGHVKGRVQFFTAGVGGPAGTVDLSYAILRLKRQDTDTDTDSDKKEPMSRQIIWANPSEMSGVSSPNPQAQREAMEALMREVLEPLWQLEREVWEDRAIATAKLRVKPFEGV